MSWLLGSKNEEPPGREGGGWANAMFRRSPYSKQEEVGAGHRMATLHARLHRRQPGTWSGPASAQTGPLRFPPTSRTRRDALMKSAEWADLDAVSKKLRAITAGAANGHRRIVMIGA